MLIFSPNEMKTEMTTTHNVRSVYVQWTGFWLQTKDGDEIVEYSRSEAIELRDFLIQLNLGK